MDGKNYLESLSKGLFTHNPKRGGIAAWLRGHAKEVEALRFAAGDADRLLTVSADQSIRTWQVSTYETLTLQMQKIREVFEDGPDSPAALVLPQRSQLKVAFSPEATDESSTSTDAAGLFFKRTIGDKSRTFSLPTRRPSPSSGIAVSTRRGCIGCC